MSGLVLLYVRPCIAHCQALYFLMSRPCHYKIFLIDSKVPAYLNVVDIAGLVKGAHEGKGLGNAFLSNISACDGIFHVVSTCDFTQSKS